MATVAAARTATLRWKAGPFLLLPPIALAVYATIGYWPWGEFGPAGFFTTPDELYLREWLLDTARLHHLAVTFPYGDLFHIWTGAWMWLVERARPEALALGAFTSWVRAGDGLLWLLFGYALLLASRRRVWIALSLLNPVVLFAAFGYAKPDFLMFAFATLAALHWSRALVSGRSRDLYGAAALFAAAAATKPSVLLLAGPWFIGLAWWSNAGATFGKWRLLGAASLSAALCVLLCPEYTHVKATMASLIAESELVRHGFPGTQVYSPWMWSAVLCLSFPLEMIWLVIDVRRHLIVRRAAILWVVLFVMYAVTVRRFMPAYLLPLIAVLVGVCLTTPDLDRPAALWGTVVAAVLFDLVALSPKMMLSQGFLTKTTYGRAAQALRRRTMAATPLSEIAFDSSGERRVAHFWTPQVVDEVRATLEQPAGWYVLSDDSVIKATVNPYGLGQRATDYVQFVLQFQSGFASRIVFSERHTFEAEKRFFEIHVGGYWPWRYIVALVRREEIAPGTNVTLYYFPPTANAFDRQ